MEILFLLLLPLLGALVGDGISHDDSAEDDAVPEQASTQSMDTPEERLADDEDAPESGKSAQDAPASLPGGDWTDEPAPAEPVGAPVKVADYDGTEEDLILEIDSESLPDATLTALEACTDPATGDVTLSMAGQKLAVLAAPNAFDLTQVSLRAV